MEIYKGHLRPGQSFPLKASALEAAIAANDVQAPVSLYQRCETWWTDGVLFRADFYPPGRFYLNEDEVLHVTCRSVSSDDKQTAKAFLDAVALPEFIQWIKHLEALPSNSTVRREKQSFTKVWPDVTA
jgi:hypothetical protein